MAERRMFAKSIIDSDAFLQMPSSTQSLYFHLCMRADDDGFVNNYRSIQRMIGASDDDFKLLLAKRFILPFETGVIVIKHWRIHNYIQSDRYVETKYIEEKSLLGIKKNKSYTFLADNEECIPLDVQRTKNIPESDTECIHDVSIMETQVSIGKDSIEENNKKENKKRKKKSELTINDIPESYIAVLDKYNLDNELKTEFKNFIVLRLQGKTKFTEHALDLSIRDVYKLYPNNSDMRIACVQQTIQRGWAGLFAVRNDFLPQKKVQTTQNSSFSSPIVMSFEEDE